AAGPFAAAAASAPLPAPRSQAAANRPVVCPDVAVAPPTTALAQTPVADRCSALPRPIARTKTSPAPPAGESVAQTRPADSLPRRSSLLPPEPRPPAGRAAN